jgi:hypothetical protein
MFKAYVDPFILACPPAESGVAEIDRFVGALLQWREMRFQVGVTLYTSADTTDVLVRTGHYPVWEVVAANLQKLDVKHIQAKDIFDIAIALLARVQSVEDVLGLHAILLNVDDWGCGTSISARDAQFVAALQNLSALIELHQQGDPGDHAVLSTGDAGQLALTGVIEDAEGPGRVAFEWPVAFAATLDVITHPESLLRRIQPLSVWTTAIEQQNADWLAEAIRLALVQRVGLAAADAREWRVNPAFPGSVFRYEAFAQPQIATATLRACVDTILGEQLSATHRLRCGPGPEEDYLKRKRDGAQAHRRDITYEYHLHYWEIRGVPELANVVPHRDATIPA